ncbi:MAG TPA: hypothetical protein VF181_02170 [Balneolaceae bacterium]
METESEKYVFEITSKSFLSLWSYPNPTGKKGKELCDILIVCGNDVIVISVKDITPTDSGSIKTDWNRWLDRAIDSSAKQIYGAERWLKGATHVIENDGTESLPLPSLENRNIHRIAVAFGGGDEMPIKFGDFGKGFVHVWDKKAFDIILKELDTITDFIEYLNSKEEHFLQGNKTIFIGHEEDYLAYYLVNNRSFPQEDAVIIIDEGIWEEFEKSPEYQLRKEEDEISYLWDSIIETYIQGMKNDHAYVNPGLINAEPALRVMALERRFGRRLLSKSLMEFRELAKNKEVRSRSVFSPFSETTYVFLPAFLDEDPQDRMAELSARCWVMRDKIRQNPTVVGIATGDLKPGHPLELFYLYKLNWSDEDIEKAKEAREELGFFKNPDTKNYNEDEYPAT